jgi:hypothetical protein
MTTWGVSAAFLTKKHNCTLAGITARCGGACCYGPTFWPGRVSSTTEHKACPRLGDKGCTFSDNDKPVTCHIYPLRLNKNNKLVLHHRAMFPTGICKGNFGNGPMLVDAMRNNLIALFGEAQYTRVRADVIAGKDSYFEVPPAVFAAYEAEFALELANKPPVPRSQQRKAK